MRENKILANMKAGKVSTGCQIAFPSTPLMELMGLAGIDFVIIDGEHGTFSWEAIDDMCRVANLAGVTPIARVPNIEPSTILRYLDRGVQGVFGPGIDSKEEAQQLVDACYYVPKGTRGLGGAPRAANYVNLADADYISSANEQMFVVAFLEHVSALESLDEIMEVEGIHAYYVGPQDMSVSMGLGRPAGPPKDQGGLGHGPEGRGSSWAEIPGPRRLRGRQGIQLLPQRHLRLHGDPQGQASRLTS